MVYLLQIIYPVFATAGQKSLFLTKKNENTYTKVYQTAPTGDAQKIFSPSLDHITCVPNVPNLQDTKYTRLM